MDQNFDFDVFLSHSSKDKPRVRRVAQVLRAAGLRLWFDEVTIAHGDDIYLAVERGLEHSRTLLLFLSSAALGSEWVALERSTALFRDPTNKARRFVPVLLEDCALPDTLKRYKYVDLRVETKEDLATLVAVCKEEMPPIPMSSTPQRKPRPPARPRKPKNDSELVPFALLSAAGFLAFLLVLWIMLAKAELLNRLGLTGQLFYALVVPLGLSAAAFLFGARRSYAVYRGKALGGVLELGGPVVVFGLVVLGGFLLPEPTTSFSLMVFVHGKGGVHDLPLQAKGFVVLDLGQDRRKEPIGGKGQAFFTGIPATFRYKTAAIFLDADGFQVAGESGTARLSSEVIYLPVQRLPFEVSGKVLDSESNPIAGAAIGLHDLDTHSGRDGAFRLVVPGEWADQSLPLSVTANGFTPWQANAVPRSHAVDVVMRKVRP